MFSAFGANSNQSQTVEKVFEAKMEEPEFSVEDRGFILTYAHVNSLNPDEEEPADKWASLGTVLGCDVGKIRDAIRSWQNEDTFVLELEDAEEDTFFSRRHSRSPVRIFFQFFFLHIQTIHSIFSVRTRFFGI